MRLFGSERIAGLMDRMGLKEGEVIQAGMMSRAIERAQRKVEENNFGIRKHLLEYDDVMNAQREVIYTRRRHAVYGERIEVDLNNIMVDFAESFVETYGDGEYEDFKFEMIRQVAVQPSFNENEFEEAKKKREVLAGMVVKDFQDAYARRMASIAATTYPVIKNVYEKNAAQYENIYVPVSDGRRVFNVPVDLKKAYDSEGKEVFKHFSKVIMLVIIDEDWKEHLREMDDLRQSVRNASYEQKDPLLIYKFESYNLFSKMLEKGNREILSTLFKAFVPVKENPDVTKQQMPQPKTDLSQLQTSRNEAAAAAGSREKSRWDETIRAPAAAGRNTNTATARWKPKRASLLRTETIPFGVVSAFIWPNREVFPQNGRHFTKGAARFRSMFRYCLSDKNRLNVSKSDGSLTDSFCPFMNSASRCGTATGCPMIGSTVSLNLAGCAVSRKTPVSPACSPSFNA